jgi:hypothetical protein
MDGSPLQSVRLANSCLLACAEPAWASVIPPTQMQGMLNLSCLLSPTVYLSDVHLGDNPNLLASFYRGETDLFSRVRELAELGCVRLLLRDETVRARGDDSVIPCDSFSDVFASWIKHDRDTAGVSREGGAERSRYFAALDELPASAIDRYSYRSVKELFIGGVRSVHHSGRPQNFTYAADDLENLSLEVRQAFDALLDREWFTLADIYQVLNGAEIPKSSGLWRLHGLLNEMAYTHVVSASMAGLDEGAQRLESLLWQDGLTPDPDEEEEEEQQLPLDWLLEQADVVLEAADLSLIGQLHPRDIAALREAGTDAFTMLRLSSDPDYVAAMPETRRALLKAMSEYWQSICDFLVRRYPHASTRPTPLGLFLGRLPRRVRRLAPSATRIAVNVGTPTATGLGAPATLTSAIAKEVTGPDFSLNFLVLSETEGLRRLRSVVPDRCWLTSKQPTLYLPSDS